MLGNPFMSELCFILLFACVCKAAWRWFSISNWVQEFDWRRSAHVIRSFDWTRPRLSFVWGWGRDRLDRPATMDSWFKFSSPLVRRLFPEKRVLRFARCCWLWAAVRVLVLCWAPFPSDDDANFVPLDGSRRVSIGAEGFLPYLKTLISFNKAEQAAIIWWPPQTWCWRL